MQPVPLEIWQLECHQGHVGPGEVAGVALAVAVAVGLPRVLVEAAVVADVIEIMSGEGLGLAAITLDTVQEADREARRHAFDSIKERQRR